MSVSQAWERLKPSKKGYCAIAMLGSGGLTFLVACNFGLILLQEPSPFGGMDQAMRRGFAQGLAPIWFGVSGGLLLMGFALRIAQAADRGRTLRTGLLTLLIGSGVVSWFCSAGPSSEAHIVAIVTGSVAVIAALLLWALLRRKFR